MNQSVVNTLLVELLTEELPPKALARLGDAFAEGLARRLVEAGLATAEARVERFASPRRLAVTIAGVAARAADRQVRQKVLPVSVALDAEGRGTAPLAKKLAALGAPNVTVDALERDGEGKNEAFFLTRTVAGATLADALQGALAETLGQLPIPKMMSYQRPDGETVHFVRPAHRLVALHGADVVPVGALGLRAERETLGHRFLSSGAIVVPHADAYADTLRTQGRVMAGFAERREAIRQGLAEAAGGDQVLMPDALVDEVTALVEWPVVYACRFDEAFLDVPQECLILTMQTNQKYFALTDAKGRLRPRFLIVSNIATDTPTAIIEGNERVVRPRLADAQFFFEQDKKRSLESRLPQLAAVVYQAKLGSQLERSERLAALAGAIAERLGEDAALASRAARLAKTDLVTEMVGEFPELQGTMGAYYARHDGEPEAVALAAVEHYQPRFAGDALPGSPIGRIVALADKLETLVGIWGVGLAPTGDKDPFALRRHALGVVRMLVEQALPLDLTELFGLAYRQLADKGFDDPSEALHAFCLDRLRSLLRERGYAAQEIDAVLAQGPRRLDDLIARLDAVRAFGALPEAAALAAANKRIGNILKKADDGEIAPAIDAAWLREPAEQALAQAVDALAPRVEADFAARRYTEALSALATLREAVDTFFDRVMVNADEAALRANRLALLARLHGLMNAVADLSRLA
ncbi:glycine--tRNA ligase subunit beta [Chitinasiproducens palmae]|uniref:Glycine--tRNA ligase beta subunit n=1 Tax=Chitinasiproducens palmae TaxID=1770053 RepID=A0A1H2PP88_9BURK|nr:glycine--tRNA ligase subunit beta [Chitinasiproducens palmae]SDV48098.1 glycyl-tRNA synthetase beta chain [Chitinasiproducens palmae]